MKKPKRCGPKSWAKHVANMQRLGRVQTIIRCDWCAKHPGLSHCDRQGLPLFDLLHHAGRYVTQDESDRIAADGP